MTFRKSILLLVSLSMIATLMACSSSGTHATVQPITVTLSTIPTSLQVSATQSITATVAHDSANGGVTWSCTPSGACGTFSAASSGSGVAVTYTAPATVPSSAVVITATSVSNTAISASTPAITLNAAPGPLADGSYVFSLTGSDTVGAFDDADFVVGVFVVKGGAITGGEQDFGDDFTFVTDQINSTGSSVSLTPDGNVQIALNTCDKSDCTQTDAALGVNGVETFSATLVSGSRALLTELDGFSSSSGTLDLQTSTAAPTGGYTFFITGQANFAPIAIGGVLNIDGTAKSTGTISGNGSVFDANIGGSATQFQAQAFAPSSVSAPDSNGRVTITLNPNNSQIAQIILVGYVVDANHIQLAEALDTFGGITSGTAFGQGANTGTFSSASASGNSYVAGMTGFDINGFFHAAGVLTANPDGTVGGVINYNDLSGIGPQSPSPVTGGTYTVDATGRVTMTGVTDGNVTLEFQLYLDGNGHALALTMDLTDVVSGIGYQQTGGGSFNAGSFQGTYAVNTRGEQIPAGMASFDLSEFDATGPITADGVGALTGFVDLNWLNGSPFQGIPPNTVPTPDRTMVGAFTAAPSGVFTGTATGLDVTTITNQDAFTYYLIDATRVIAIETDPNQLTLGSFELQSQ